MVTVVSSISDFQKIRKKYSQKKLGFVPTMGALHQGHLSLIEKSIEENDVTVVSIFVNKTQFNEESDYTNYPVELAADITQIEKIANSNKDIIILNPSYAQIYPDNYRYKLKEFRESNILCGKSRPGHFDGVLTVVMKFLNIVKPFNAYFGKKDYQQFDLIREMSKAFFMDVNIVGCDIIRDDEGLALSSRNKRLNSEQLVLARKINKVLQCHQTTLETSEKMSEMGLKVDYVYEWRGRVFVAAFVGDVRLIDNLEMR